MGENQFSSVKQYHIVSQKPSIFLLKSRRKQIKLDKIKTIAKYFENNGQDDTFPVLQYYFRLWNELK